MVTSVTYISRKDYTLACLEEAMTLRARIFLPEVARFPLPINSDKPMTFQHGPLRKISPGMN